MTKHGYALEKYLPDGRLIGVNASLSFGKARIIIGDEYSVENGW